MLTMWNWGPAAPSFDFGTKALGTLMHDTTAASTAGPRTDSQRSRSWWITCVAALSGFAGLGYEIVWTRLLAVALGHEIVAVLGVIAALFAGLALGSLVPGRWIATSARPGRWYAGLELAIGLWAIVLIFLFPSAADLVPVFVPVRATP